MLMKKRCRLYHAVASAFLWLAVSTIAFAENKSHSPQRPLPNALDGRLTEGPKYYVDPIKGEDSSEGTSDKPWRTIQHGVEKLVPGDTLYLREGVYHEHVYLTESGLPDEPITIAAYPGELPILDGGLRQFRESPETSWQPIDSGADEFVSTSTFPDAADRLAPNQFIPGAWEPMLGREHLRPLALGHFADSMVPLHGYRTVEDLRAANEMQPPSKDSGAVYCGPGMWFNRETKRIHIRLAHHTLPGLGDRAYRGETDPRKLPLIVAVGFGRDVLRINGIKHVRIEGLVLRGATGSPLIHVYGSEDIELDHVTAYGGFPALLVNACQRLRVTHSAFRGLAAPWSGRSHMKYRGTPSYQIVLRDSKPINEDIEFANCEFTDDHDFAYFRFAKNLNFHHNFVDNFNDDGLECGAKLSWHSFHIHHNRIGACLGVLQQHEIARDESPAYHEPGSGMYFYRNVVDQREGAYYGLPREADPSGAFLRHEGALLSDHGSPVYPVMRIYHNTFLRRGPVWRNYFLFGFGARALKNTERDVFNNLFVQFEGVPGAVILGKEPEQLREGGNLLWGIQEGPMLKTDPFAKLRKSPLFERSKAVYSPGWSTQDMFADPKFVRLAEGERPDLRLSNSSPAINAGVPLPEQWPDPLRAADEGRPDIGAIPKDEESWNVGIDSRIPVFGGPFE